MSLSNKQLTHAPVGVTLLKMSGSVLIGFIAAAAFNITDTYFVARLGTVQLAAMSFTFPIAMLVQGLAMGVGVGASAVLAQLLGKGELGEVRRVTTDALILGLGMVVVLASAGLLTIRPLFGALGATPEILPYVEEYMQVWYFGIMFVVVPMIGNNAIRATGDTLTPSIIMTVDVGLNIILDPIMIFGFGPCPAMGIRGAALATVICRALALVASLYVLRRRKKMLALTWPRFGHLYASAKTIFKVGLPIAVAHMLMPISAGIFLNIIARFGTAAVAGYGAGSRIEMFVVLPIIAIGTSLVPFVGQNFGAMLPERIRQASKAATVFVSFWSVLMVLTLWATGSWVAGAFTQDPEVKKVLCKFLWILPLAFGFRGLFHIASSKMNGLGKSYPTLILSIIKQFLLILPLAALGAYLANLTGLFVGVVVAEVLSGIAATRLGNIVENKCVGKFETVQPPTTPTESF